MASAVLGKVSPTPKGEYVSTQDYDRLDVVTYEGYPYLAKSNVPSGNLPTDELYWMPLLIGLDFAPGGYGLGAHGIYCSDCNNATKNGWYRFDASTLNIAPSASQGSLFVRNAESSSGVSVYQTMWNGYWRAYRFYGPWDNTWSEWEFENPPLMANVEYRTTERVDGKAVYKKRDSSGKILYRLDGSSTWIEGLPGAAPSGYGLGEIRAPFINTTAQVNALRAFGLNEFYSTSETACEGVSGLGQGSILTIPTMYAVTQYFFCRYPYSGCVLKRISYVEVDNGWNPWEWVNPPMQLGVEYRTTERWNGAAVYAKLVDCGALPDKTSKSVTFASETTAAAFAIRGRAVNSGELISIPWLPDISVKTQKNKIIITTADYFGSWYGYVGVKYTK